MEVICLQTEAFYKLVEEVVQRVQPDKDDQRPWVGTEEAMAILGISAKSTLQEYRDNGEIEYSQPRKRIILYKRQSLYDFLERHSKKRF